MHQRMAAAKATATVIVIIVDNNDVDNDGVMADLLHGADMIARHNRDGI